MPRHRSCRNKSSGAFHPFEATITFKNETRSIIVRRIIPLLFKGQWERVFSQGRKRNYKDTAGRGDTGGE